MKKFLLIIIGSLLIITNSNAESFSKALSKAFKDNSELNAERENIIISEQELKISQGNYLPTVTLSGSKSQEDTNKLTNQSGGNATINDVDPFTTSIKLEQTISVVFILFPSLFSQDRVCSFPSIETSCPFVRFF